MPRSQPKGALTAAQLMSSPVVTLRTDETMRQAAERLLERDIGGAPVLDHRGVPVGILSKTDFLRYDREYAIPTAAEWRRLAAAYDPLRQAALRGPEREREEDYVLHWMTRGIVAVAPEASLAETARLMAAKGVHRLLVREEGRLVGIVTPFDVLRAVGGARARAARAPVAARGRSRASRRRPRTFTGPASPGRSGFR